MQLLLFATTVLLPVKKRKKITKNKKFVIITGTLDQKIILSH